MVKNISKYRLVEDLHIAFVHMAKHAHIAPQPLPTYLNGHINTSRKLLPNQLTGLIHIRPIPWYMYHGEKHFEKQSGTPTHCICALAQTCTHFTAAITHLH